jgi:putative NAD(P)H nitroreductase
MELKDVVINRHSVNNFDPSFVVTKEDIDQIIELNKLAPSAFNMEHARYHVILDKDLKEKFYNEVCNQDKVLASSATILVVGDKRPHLKAKDRLSDKMYELIDSSYSEEVYAKEDAIRNASLSAMQFMLIAKDLGFDTCPMTGFDFDKAKEFFNLDEEEIVLLITLGKEDVNKKKERGYRSNTNDLVKYY